MVHMDKFCLTYKNPQKRTLMMQKFAQLGWQVRMCEGVDVHDSIRAPSVAQITQAKNHNRWDAHAWSVMQGHMCMLETFVQEGHAPYVMCMEDDILIRRDINEHLPKIMADFELCNLDLCMLGYLAIEPLHHIQVKYPQMNQVFTFHEYPFHVFGTQMYVMKRSHAEWLVSMYGHATGWHTHVLETDGTYNADWLITKQGTTACVYPLLAVEQRGGGTVYADAEQTDFHDMCHEANYLPHIHL